MTNLIKNRFLIVSIIVLMTSMVTGQSKNGFDKKALQSCKVVLNKNTLVLSNSIISRTFLWNQGNLVTLEIRNQLTNQNWHFNSSLPDMVFPDMEMINSIGELTVDTIINDEIAYPHLKAIIITKLGTLEIKRLFRIYPDCPAIACDIFMRGKAQGNWIQYDNKKRLKTAVMERLSPSGPHWEMESVEFADETDANNTLVHQYKSLAFRRQNLLRGNLVFAIEKYTGNGFFILKESPGCEDQHLYPGCDFSVMITPENNLELEVTGFGISPEEITADQWIRCYGFVTGVTGGDALSKMKSLRSYQEKIRIHKADRDEMIMMNTWGDRGQDKKISESFIENEIKIASKLGISHLQIDDGWQTGRTKNSAFGGGSLQNIWSTSDYWKINKERFPDGFKPISSKVKELGVEIALWFNPSTDNSYEHWQKDASVLIDFYNQYGIRVFKIDGIDIPDKQAEINLRKMFEKVMSETGKNTVINLDVTGIAKRPGYHFINEYGNIFLENRYTDWNNYYPHWTLRNLWMLSAYLPAQNLQIEFLNPWRNSDKYSENDIFAPHNIPFDYQFAITMMGQPLAWFEGSGLPPEALSIAPLIKKYRETMIELHSGQIFPLGDEPDGYSWTGFQSLRDSSGFLLIFREWHENSEKEISTWLPAHTKVKFTHVLGNGQDFTCKTGNDGKVIIRLPDKWDFVLYRYNLK